MALIWTIALLLKSMTIHTILSTVTIHGPAPKLDYSMTRCRTDCILQKWKHWYLSDIAIPSYNLSLIACHWEIEAVFPLIKSGQTSVMALMKQKMNLELYFKLYTKIKTNLRLKYSSQNYKTFRRKYVCKYLWPWVK